MMEKLAEIWKKIRRFYGVSYEGFLSALVGLPKKEAEALFEIAQKAVHKNSIGEIIRKHPELKDYVRSEADRECMLYVYAYLLNRLGKKEREPPYKKIIINFGRAFWRGTEYSQEYE